MVISSLNLGLSFFFIFLHSWFVVYSFFHIIRRELSRGACKFFVSRLLALEFKTAFL